MELDSWKGCKWWLSFRISLQILSFRINEPGVAICAWCMEPLHYVSCGNKNAKIYAIQDKEGHLKNTDPNKVANLHGCAKPFDILYGLAANGHDY